VRWSFPRVRAAFVRSSHFDLHHLLAAQPLVGHPRDRRAEDHPMFKPAPTMARRPQPVMISYQ
jgi:hypothetical protein